jgi:hypothetical protein
VPTVGSTGASDRARGHAAAGELRRGERIPWRVIAAQIVPRANAAARAGQMQVAVTGASISLLLSATIVCSGGSAVSNPSSAAPPRSRKRSSAVASACRSDQGSPRTTVYQWGPTLLRSVWVQVRWTTPHAMRFPGDQGLADMGDAQAWDTCTESNDTGMLSALIFLTGSVMGGITRVAGPAPRGTRRRRPGHRRRTLAALRGGGGTLIRPAVERADLAAIAPHDRSPSHRQIPRKG